MNVHDFRKMKEDGEPIAIVTAYDYWSARIVAASAVDAILIGDSAAMVMHGFSTTLAATPEMMATHVAAVSRGAPQKFIIADMPFLVHRKGLLSAMECVEKLVRAGAHAVKIEGVAEHDGVIRHIVQSGIPAMGHLGLTPQSVHALGGMKTISSSDSEEKRLLDEAHLLEEAGCFSVILECIPASIAESITDELAIPTIGIGAGSHVSGQVLVLHDLLGLLPDFQPKFVRRYINGAELIQSALNHFASDVKSREFPTEREGY